MAKQPAQSTPRKPRNVRAKAICYIGDVLREPGSVFVHDGPLGDVLEEVAPGTVPAPQDLLDKLVKGVPLETHQKTGTHEPKQQASE